MSQLQASGTTPSRSSLMMQQQLKYYNADVDSWVTVDAQYTYTLPEISFLSSSTVTLGAKNLLDEEAPWVPNNTSYDPVTHDFRGRVWYVRVGASM